MMHLLVLVCFIMIFAIYAASVIQYIKEEEKRQKQEQEKAKYAK